MRNDLTDLTLVIDRSGSMQSIREDAEGGVNALLQNQAKEPGDALVTLVQFDTVYEFVHRAVPIRNVPAYTLEPRGSTALLDAVGRAINETGQRLAAMVEHERPGFVAFVIVTDGQENSSKEFSASQVREMIAHQQSVYSWHFTFLAADQDAFAEAAKLGIDRKDAAAFARGKVAAAYDAVDRKMSRLRKSKVDSMPVEEDFTAEERQSML